MAMVHLPDELARRLEAEAARTREREDLAVEAFEGRYGKTSSTPDGERADALAAFIGSGDSGDPGWASRDIHELRAEAAARKFAEGA